MFVQILLKALPDGTEEGLHHNGSVDIEVTDNSGGADDGKVDTEEIEEWYW